MISDQIFHKFSSILQKEIGLALPINKKYLLYTRLAGRLRKLGLADFASYYKLILADKSKLTKLCNLLTTNVTYFFREDYHFKYLEKKVLPEFDLKNKKIRAWCAGCSTGEEAYSLAIVLAQFFQKNKLDIEILATDINTEVLDIASKGIYSYQRVSNIPYELLTKYFMLGKKGNKGFFKIKKDIRRMLQFRVLNLNLDNFSFAEKFDFIFCRNVFIYFNQSTKEKILGNFYKSVKDDGYLFLGHADSAKLKNAKWIQVWKTTYRKKV